MTELSGTLSGESDLNGEVSAGVVDRTQILQYESIYEFPNRGSVGTIYIDTSENATYRWDENGSRYYCIGRDYTEIGTITGGDK